MLRGMKEKMPDFFKLEDFVPSLRQAVEEAFLPNLPAQPRFKKLPRHSARDSGPGGLIEISSNAASCGSDPFLKRSIGGSLQKVATFRLIGA
jgi:hypothetical protein